MHARKKYSLIQGTFHIVGYAPDGDSIRFRPTNPDHWWRVYASNTRQKRPKEVQLIRLQGIDALETHYTPPQIKTQSNWQTWQPRQLAPPPLPQFSQPAKLGQLAAQYLLDYLGVCRVKWEETDGDKTVATAYYRSGKAEMPMYNEAEQLPGYIITHDTDLTNRRPLAWVFAGDMPDAHYNGKRLSEDDVAALVDRSVNYQMVHSGVVYPYIFMTMGEPMRHIMAKAAEKARKAAAVVQYPHEAKSVWSLDRCTLGVELTHIQQVEDRYALHPLFFRQIVRLWYQENMETYHAMLRSKDDQPFSYDDRLDLTNFYSLGDHNIYVVSQNDYTQLSDVMTISANELKLKTHLSDLVFIA